MSYDLMVFDASAAPRDRAAFMAWYDQQTLWMESHGYNDPDIPTPELRHWFREMIEHFPPMNGPLASQEVDDPRITDYAVGRFVIYAAFAWSQADAAHDRMYELAAKHRVGFFDVSSSSGDVWFPAADGGFESSRSGCAWLFAWLFHVRCAGCHWLSQFRRSGSA